MKILYGVVGEGMGHAMRSGVVLEHLLARGHAVQVMASGRAKDYLEKRVGERAGSVNRIHGFHLIYEENRVRMGKTLVSNVLAGASGIPQNIAAYFDLVTEFRPELVVSDFESWTYLYAKNHRLPIVSIDNMQIINRAVMPDAIKAGVESDFQMAKAFVKAKLPFCDHYVITTFFYPELRKEKTTLVPPILRPEILAAKPSRGDHLLVYQTAEGYDALATTLKQTGLECRIYGMQRDITTDVRDGHLLYRPFSEATFIADLASCRGVIAGGGFTLMGEAVYLRKPMLAVPLSGQFEQEMNARWLERLGYGMAAPDLVHRPEQVDAFLRGLPACEGALAAYTQDSNARLYEVLDTLFDRAQAGVL